MKALISVSDKTEVVQFAKNLASLGFELLSTGGTYKLLKSHNLEVVEVSDFTGANEMFEGRVKTLHPKIHGAILHKRDEHKDEALRNGIDRIDLVCVNLYPFKQTIQKSDDFDEIIENIDIGGPTLIRAAAKNFNDVMIVTDINDYDVVVQKIKDNHVDIEFKKSLMIKAFEHTASYDAVIANYMNSRFNLGFGARHFIVGEKVFDTKYGENPHQKGALYEFENDFSKHFKAHKGEASFNNLTDIYAAIKIAGHFADENAVAIIKHANPCGFAIRDNLADAFKAALKCDPISAYGGVVAVNGVLDKSVAEAINEIYAEVIVATSVSKEAMEIFESKKRIKIFSTGGDRLFSFKDKFDFKFIGSGFVLQTSDEVSNDEITNATCVSKNVACKEQIKDMQIANMIAAYTKSNCVVYVKDSAMLAIGMGMTSRIDAMRAAVTKAKELGLSLKGAILASEAFFPFRDSIDLAAKENIACVIQPGGSIRDNEVIEAANEYGIALYFSGKRHFLH